MNSTQRTSFPKDQIKVLLLENIHPVARGLFSSEGFQIEALPGALTPEQLRDKIRDVHILGIRSKTHVTREVFDEAKRLLTLGCFCIGTNQVELEAAKAHGVPVFNAPFGNTRSVAELVISEVVMLSRQLAQRSMEMHQGIWKKIATNCFEIRGKTLGIIGYGNIGSQVSALAESMGMKVIFYDVVSKLPLGNARNAGNLQDLLKESDFVSLHVPATPQTERMISESELKIMKKGSYLLNACRGSVVDVPTLAKHLRSGHLAGAAVDVFPEEPEINTDSFKSELQGIPNVVMTPHIGGATEEAQFKIGEEVPAALIRFTNSGSTSGAVNFPSVDLPMRPGSHRILNVHKNVPGVLREINRIISDLGANINAQTLATDPEIGYLVLDTDRALSLEVKHAIEKLDTSIKTWILY